IDLPEPDSPTMPRVSPRRSSSSTPRTALSVLVSVGVATDRSRISNKDSVLISASPIGHGDIADTIPEQVDGNHQHDESTAGQDHQRGLEEHDRLSFGDHQPTGRGR